jgi:hypothetical protein
VAERTSLGGQTLMELALVLPCFCLGIFMAVQLICLCHNMVELQRMATVALHKLTLETYQDREEHYWFHSLWGHFKLRQDRYRSQVPEPWRPFKGISIIDRAGRIVQVNVRSRLLPGGVFSRALDPLVLEANAETLLEPPVPEDI